MKKGFFLLILILFCTTIGKGLHRLKEGFSPRRIQCLEMHTDPLNEETVAALSQEFYYIGRGRQCFAFASQDDRYVLKFPRTDIYKTPFWARVLPVKSYREAIEADHGEREKLVMDSFRLSYTELKEQTGVIALHLGQSDSPIKITLVDALGCKHHLPAGKTSFLLQYKRTILMKAFLSALHDGDRSKAEKILDSLVAVVIERAKKGILNKDRSFLRNYGFDGEKGYQIDVGSFYRKPGIEGYDAYHKSIRDSMDAVKEWLAKNDPEMLQYLNNQLDTKTNYTL